MNAAPAFAIAAAGAVVPNPCVRDHDLGGRGADRRGRPGCACRRHVCGGRRNPQRTSVRQPLPFEALEPRGTSPIRRPASGRTTVTAGDVSPAYRQPRLLFRPRHRPRRGSRGARLESRFASSVSRSAAGCGECATRTRSGHDAADGAATTPSLTTPRNLPMAYTTSASSQRTRWPTQSPAM